MSFKKVEKLHLERKKMKSVGGAKKKASLSLATILPNTTKRYVVGDLVWVKIGFYPFWPSMITYDPITGEFYKESSRKNGKKKITYHVQYFGKTAMRGWTVARSIFPFEGKEKFKAVEKSALDKVNKRTATYKMIEKLFRVSAGAKKLWNEAIDEALKAFAIKDINDRLEANIFNYYVPSGALKRARELDLDLDTNDRPVKRCLINENSGEPYCKICGRDEPDFACTGSCSKAFHKDCLGVLRVPPGFKCPDCDLDEHSCFVCKSPDGDFIKCSLSKCGKSYHENCLSRYNCGNKEKNICPRHTCLTCYNENPKNVMARKGTMLQCTECPTAYHTHHTCIAAGSKIMGPNTLVCPDHFSGKHKSSKEIREIPRKHESSKKKRKTAVKQKSSNEQRKIRTINVLYCCICCQGGELVCCEICPNAYHKSCINAEVSEGDFFCEDCMKRKHLTYGTVIWGKTGKYRWWPAKIMHPDNIPQNVQKMKHLDGDFPVLYFGTGEYDWLHRGRVIPYAEHHKEMTECPSTVTTLKLKFKKSLKEASEAYDEYQLLRASENSMSEEPEEYKPIKVNKAVPPAQIVPLDVTSSTSPCLCDPSMDNPCGPESSCLNMSLLMECHSGICNADERCKNRRFQKRQYASVKRIKTVNRGWGLITCQEIKKADFVIEYVGEVITDKEYRKRADALQAQGKSKFYFLQLDSSRLIDAGPRGNDARFINHSCDPNCEMVKWSVNGDVRIGIFALYDIAAGEELTFNYECDTRCQQKCFCGSANCSGIIGRSLSSVSKVTKQPSQNKKQVANKDAIRRKLKRKINIDDPEDNHCFICKNTGCLLLCDYGGCMRAYHPLCLGMINVPEGDWKCPLHFCSICYLEAYRFCSNCPVSYCQKHLPSGLKIEGKRFRCSTCWRPSESALSFPGVVSQSVSAPSSSLALVVSQSVSDSSSSLAVVVNQSVSAPTSSLPGVVGQSVSALSSSLAGVVSQSVSAPSSSLAVVVSQSVSAPSSSLAVVVSQSVSGPSSSLAGAVGRSSSASSSSQDSDEDVIFIGEYNTSSLHKCICGSENCRSYFGAFFSALQVTKQPSEEKTGVTNKGPERSESEGKMETYEPKDNHCFICKNPGSLISCGNAGCRRAYHIECLGIDSPPEGPWTCPVHFCLLCYLEACHFCSNCPVSYCEKDYTTLKMQGKQYRCSNCRRPQQPHPSSVPSGNASSLAGVVSQSVSAPSSNLARKVSQRVSAPSANLAGVMSQSVSAPSSSLARIMSQSLSAPSLSMVQVLSQILSVPSSSMVRVVSQIVSAPSSSLPGIVSQSVSAPSSGLPTVMSQSVSAPSSGLPAVMSQSVSAPSSGPAGPVSQSSSASSSSQDSGEEVIIVCECNTSGPHKCCCGCENCRGYYTKRLSSVLQVTKQPSEDKTGVAKKGPERSESEGKIETYEREDNHCFICKNPGSLISCKNAGCIKVYHISCLGESIVPEGDWMCPWHYCRICGLQAHCFCLTCPVSYCQKHLPSGLKVKGMSFRCSNCQRLHRPHPSLACSESASSLAGIVSQSVSTSLSPPAVVSRRVSAPSTLARVLDESVSGQLASLARAVRQGILAPSSVAKVASLLAPSLSLPEVVSQRLSTPSSSRARVVSRSVLAPSSSLPRVVRQRLSTLSSSRARVVSRSVLAPSSSLGRVGRNCVSARLSSLAHLGSQSVLAQTSSLGQVGSQCVSAPSSGLAHLGSQIVLAPSSSLARVGPQNVLAPSSSLVEVVCKSVSAPSLSLGRVGSQSVSAPSSSLARLGSQSVLSPSLAGVVPMSVSVSSSSLDRVGTESVSASSSNLAHLWSRSVLPPSSSVAGVVCMSVSAPSSLTRVVSQSVLAPSSSLAGVVHMSVSAPSSSLGRVVSQSVSAPSSSLSRVVSQCVSAPSSSLAGVVRHSVSDPSSYVTRVVSQSVLAPSSSLAGVVHMSVSASSSVSQVVSQGVSAPSSLARVVSQSVSASSSSLTQVVSQSVLARSSSLAGVVHMSVSAPSSSLAVVVSQSVSAPSSSLARVVSQNVSAPTSSLAGVVSQNVSAPSSSLAGVVSQNVSAPSSSLAGVVSRNVSAPSSSLAGVVHMSVSASSSVSQVASQGVSAPSSLARVVSQSVSASSSLAGVVHMSVSAPSSSLAVVVSQSVSAPSSSLAGVVSQNVSAPTSSLAGVVSQNVSAPSSGLAGVVSQNVSAASSSLAGVVGQNVSAASSSLAGVVNQNVSASSSSLAGASGQHAGEELTSNNECGTSVEQKCVCGTASCSCFLQRGFSSVPELATQTSENNGYVVNSVPVGSQSERNVQTYVRDTHCFACRNSGSVMSCGIKGCIRVYHIRCVGMTLMPQGNWACPWHACSTCYSAAQCFCSGCPLSYCLNHLPSGLKVQGNLFRCSKCQKYHQPQPSSAPPESPNSLVALVSQSPSGPLFNQYPDQVSSQILGDLVKEDETAPIFA